MPGFWSRVIRGQKALPSIPFDTYDPAQRVLPAPYEPFTGLSYTSGGIPIADPGVPLSEYHEGSVDQFWKTQPNVRKVVDFIARNVASIPLRVYTRVSDTDRRRVDDHPISRALVSPQPGTSPFRFWRSVLSDGLLYDRWAVMIAPSESGELELVQIPSSRLRFRIDGLRRVTGAYYWTGDPSRPKVELDLDSLIYDHGYAPSSAGLSPIRTLRDTLMETSAAIKWRNQVWENGARVPAWIERPAEAEWSNAARERFKAGFREDFTGTGENAGGVPLMEDGMKLHELSAFKPVDTGDLEGRRLSSIEVSSAFHIAPELIGAREGTYSNVDAFRQMLYRDSLGPYISAWEGALNAQLVRYAAPSNDVYIEAHIESKLRGSFEEQAKVKSSATGAPWLTRNEARALENRPPVAGGDELVTPLNVLVGGQASPRDSGSQNESARDPAQGQDISRSHGKVSPSASEGRKALGSDQQRERLSEVLSGFFRRQGAEVLSEIGSGSFNWWDAERWDRELADDLFAVSHTLATILGATEAANLGYPGNYDPDLTVEFLRKVARNRAETINQTTKNNVNDAIADPDGDPATVFAEAEESRSKVSGQQILALVAGFATIEAARQINRDQGVEFTKTWITGPNPRPEHAALDGETVPIDQTFSNGMDWPGIGGDADDTGCNCSTSVQATDREATS